jgi:ferredoxin-NADP reductase
MLWHATMSWYYITAGLILYAVDHMIRFSRCVGISVNVEYANVIENGESSVIFLSYKAHMPSLLSLTKPKPFTYEMGQYVFINIPDISIAEWHPFTISSAPNDSIMSHHIKSHDNNQWTGKLRDYINSLDRIVSTNPFKNININIDGPYGLPLDVSKYSSILLVAGGIGITPMHSCLRQIYTSIKANSNLYPNLRKVRLVWVSRVNEKMFDYTWNMVLSDNINGASSSKLFSCAKYLTKKNYSSSINSPLGSNNSNHNSVKSLVSSMASSATSSNSSYNFYEYCEVYDGRPNLEKEIFDSHGQDLTCVYACGPGPLIQECEEISIRFTNMEFKKEYFEL